MQRYFFDISDGVQIHDDVGRLMPSLEAARLHAITRATEFVAKLDGGGQGGYIVITIRDVGAILAVLRLVCQIAAPSQASSSTLPGKAAA